MERTVSAADVSFANHCSSTGPDVELVTPAEAAEWSESESPYCVVVEDAPEHYGGFDPLGLEGPCGGERVCPARGVVEEFYAVVTGTGEGNYALHVATRIEETDLAPVWACC